MRCRCGTKLLVAAAASALAAVPAASAHASPWRSNDTVLGGSGPHPEAERTLDTPEMELRAGGGDALLSLQPRDPGPPGGGEDNVALANKLSNPVSSMISVPFQFNADDGYGPSKAERLTLNIQPVVPFSIGDDWNLIVRTIVPLIYQESPAPALSSEGGLGDITQSFFFSPKEPVGGWILGMGPVALWPTGTDPSLRSEQLGLGPTAVALRQDSGWTYGILANHLWGLTQSDDHPDVNATFLQPFVSYTFPTATSLTLNTESTYDWNAEQWTVPVNLMVGQIMKLGGQPVQFTVGGRYFADKPDGGPEWGLRLGFTLLFPK